MAHKAKHPNLSLASPSNPDDAETNAAVVCAAEVNATATIRAAEISAAATILAAEISANAVKDAADRNYAAYIRAAKIGAVAVVLAAIIAAVSTALSADPTPVSYQQIIVQSLVQSSHHKRANPILPRTTKHNTNPVKPAPFPNTKETQYEDQ